MLQLIMDNIPQAVFWKNRESIYIYSNRNFAIDAGVVSPTDIVGKTDHDLAWTPKQAGFSVTSINGSWTQMPPIYV